MSKMVQYCREKSGSDHPDTLQSIRTMDEWRGVKEHNCAFSDDHDADILKCQ